MHRTSLPTRLLLVLPLMGASTWSQDPAPTPTEQEAAQAREQARALADLLERLEAGLQAEVIEVGRPLVAEGGLLASDGQAIAAVARALFDAGLEAEADQLLVDARPSEPTAVLVELEVARLAIARDQLDRARTLLQAPAGSPQPVKRPDQPDAWLLLARVYARDGRLDLGAQLAKRMLELSPLHPEAASAWHLLSRDAVARRETELAQQYLERASFLRDWHDLMRARRLQIRLTPEDPLPRLGLALGWMKVERWSEAERALTELVASFPDYCRAYFQLGEARRLSGNTPGAIEAYEIGQGCDPTDMRLAFNRALLLREVGRGAEALVELQRVVASPSSEDPLFLGAHLELARGLRDADRQAESEAAYARYRALGGTESI